MGLITITVQGSFMSRPTKTFTAIHGGHTQAVAEAISFLSGKFLSNAIKQDHMLHEQGDKPEVGFGESGSNPN